VSEKSFQSISTIIFVVVLFCSVGGRRLLLLLLALLLFDVSSLALHQVPPRATRDAELTDDAI
jgi:hypothetical protein